jgi:Flp pilus assembly protein TadD
VDVYYALIDRMLGQWMRRSAEDGATLLVHSDHGFKWGARRTCERSSQQWNTAAYWHRLEGVLAVWGARVRPSAERGRASVFDVAPTIASLLGVPADRRMTGRPLTRFFRDLAPPPRRDAFGSVTVRRVSAAAMSEKEAGEYAKKLLALGYLSGSDTRALEPTGGDRPAMTEGAWNNLGLYLRETVRDLEAARAAFEKSLSLRSDYASPMFNLAILHRARRDDEKAQEWLFRSLAAGHADPEGTLLRWSAEYGKNGRRAQARTLLERAVREHPDFEQVALELALMRFQSSRDCPGAYAVLSRFEAATENPAILNALGLFHTCLGRRDQAVALFERSLAVKADQPAVVQSLDLVRRGAPSAATRP